MSSLPHDVAPPAAPRTGENETLDIYVLAARVVHEAETLLASAEGFLIARGHIESAFQAALALTATSSWAEVRAARDHLDAAREELHRSYYHLR